MERSIPVGTHLVVDGGRRVGPFSGIDLGGGLVLEGVSSPIIAGDVDVVQQPSVRNLKKKPNEKTKLAAKEKGKSEAPVEAALASKPRQSDTMVLDFGNTRLHGAIRTADGKSVRVDIPYGDLEKGREFFFEKALRPVLVTVASRQLDVLTLIFCSVKERSATKQALAVLQRHIERLIPSLAVETLEVSGYSVLERAGLQGEYNGQNIGVDRALRFHFAAKKARETRHAVAVVAAGTALTCEAVSAEGRILESLIGPGLTMSLDALHEHTAKLPSLAWNREALEPPEVWDTSNSMMRGVAFAEAGAVVNLVLLHGVRHLFVSGGDAAALCELLKPLLAKLDGVELTLAEGLETDSLFELGQDLLREKPGILPSALGVTAPKFVADAAGGAGSTSGVGTQFEGNDSARQIIESMSIARRRRLVSRTDEQSVDDFRRLGVRVEAQFAGRRLDSYLAERFKFHTRDKWHERIAAREVCIQPNAQRTPTAKPEPVVWVKHTYRLKNCDQIWLYQPPEHEPDSVMQCDVLGDDGDVVIFSKPGNLVIHAVGQYSRNTFLHVAERMGYGDAAPIHRIDRETSGILVCARSLSNRRAVADAFRDGAMRKMYLAVSKLSSDLPDRFRVAEPIGDAVGSKIRLKLWIGGAGAVDALTNFVVLSRSGDYALIACFPKTGRTNQIRIHLAAAGAWIVGDKMYYPDEEIFLEFYENGLTETVLAAVEFPRHMLHNVAIQGPDGLPPILSENPVICNFPADFSAFAPLSELMTLAGISADSAAQGGLFRRLFESWVDADFSDTPLLPYSIGR
jgi:23S rRNA pseudouridine1911/1915/1917 synthase